MATHNEKWFYRTIDAALRAVLRWLPPSSISQGTALYWGYRFRPAPRVVSLRSGMRFRFESVDFIPLMIYYTGVFEPHVIRLLKMIARPGATVLDVGANIGFHTLEAWRAVGNSGRVISIEASPEHAATIRRNLETNGLPVKDIINVAVGDRNGEVALARPDGGNQGMFGINAGTEDAFFTPIKRIDDLVESASLSSLALIKIDIEGSELAALRGAAETLRRHTPAILIELNDVALARCGASSADIVTFLNEAGYDGWVIAGRGLRTITNSEPHECDECLFLPRRESRIRERLKLETLTL